MTDDDVRAAERKRKLTMLLVAISICEAVFCCAAVFSMINEWQYGIAFLITVVVIHGFLFLAVILYFSKKAAEPDEMAGFDD